MTLHRRHQTGPRLAGVRLALRDQLDLQHIVLDNVAHSDIYKGEFYWNVTAARAARILQRHGVEVHLNPHSGQVTFNPEVITA